MRTVRVLEPEDERVGEEVKVGVCNGRVCDGPDMRLERIDFSCERLW